MPNGYPSAGGVNSLWPFLHYLFDSQGVLGVLGATGINSFFVDPVNGSDNASGKSIDTAVKTLTQALTFVTVGNYVFMAPGRYDESPTVVKAQKKLTLIGMGGRGAAFIEPSASNASGLTNHADDVTIVNLGLASKGTGTSFRNSGDRLRVYASKIEGGTNGLNTGPGTVAQIAAGTWGKGADGRFEDCEFAYSTNGVLLTSSDFGACTQTVFKGCLFHNLTTVHIKSNDVAASNICVRDLWLEDNYFANAEDGTGPTDFLLVNVTNDTGFITGNRFAFATNEADVITIATNVFYSANATEAGWSTARPS